MSGIFYDWNDSWLAEDFSWQKISSRKVYFRSHDLLTVISKRWKMVRSCLCPDMQCWVISEHVYQIVQQVKNTGWPKSKFLISNGCNSVNFDPISKISGPKLVWIVAVFCDKIWFFKKIEKIKDFCKSIDFIETLSRIRTQDLLITSLVS